jgi:hypothetical protein
MQTFSKKKATTSKKTRQINSIEPIEDRSHPICDLFNRSFRIDANRFTAFWCNHPALQMFSPADCL